MISYLKFPTLQAYLDWHRAPTKGTINNGCLYAWYEIEGAIYGEINSNLVDPADIATEEKFTKETFKTVFDAAPKDAEGGVK